MSQSSVLEGLELLKKPDFAKLFAAYLITYTGTAMAPIAIAFGVLDLTGSTSKAAFVIAAPVVAQIILILIGGALADRTSRQRMLVFSDVLAMCSQLLIAYCFLTGLATVPLLISLMLVSGSAAALSAPAATGFVPQMVEPGELQAANALLGVARNSAMMVGAALAGILVATVGAGVTLLIDAISFGVSAILIFSLRPAVQTHPDEASLIQDMRLGWREFISHTWLWTIVLQFSLVVAAMEAVFGLLGPAVTKMHMDGAIDWGIISAGFGFGTLVGGVVALRIEVKRPMYFATFCTFLFCVVPLSLSVPLPVWVIAALSFIEGIAGQIFAVLWYTTQQKMIAPHMLSRVSAYDHLGSIVLAPLGIVAGGFLFELIGFRSTLLIAAAVIVLPALGVLTVRDVRELTTVAVNIKHEQNQV
jgi:predicted MFS family arabinose efflux permease